MERAPGECPRLSASRSSPSLVDQAESLLPLELQPYFSRSVEPAELLGQLSELRAIRPTPIASRPTLAMASALAALRAATSRDAQLAASSPITGCGCLATGARRRPGEGSSRLPSASCIPSHWAQPSSRAPTRSSGTAAAVTPPRRARARSARRPPRFGGRGTLSDARLERLVAAGRAGWSGLRASRSSRSPR